MDKKFEKIRFEKSLIKDLILEVLDDVRVFIVRNNLILVGGMALDYALRLKGSKLYSVDVLPDYDFLSPEHYKHSLLLGEELQKKYPDSKVDVIPALHVTTMRVRIDGNFIADITYCPLTVFTRVPVINYQNLNIVHPHYTIMDQLAAFASPFVNSPKEVIYQRWLKDMKRMILILKNYPIKELKWTTINYESKALGDDANKVALDGNANKVALDNTAKKVTSGGSSVDGKKVTSDDKKKVITQIGDDANKIALIGWHALKELGYVDVKNCSGEKKIYIHSMLHKDNTDFSDANYYNTLLGIPRYLETKTERYYDCYGMGLVLENNKIAAIQTIAWFFASEYIFGNNEKSMTGLQKCLDIISNGQIINGEITDISDNKQKYYMHATPLLTNNFINHSSLIAIESITNPRKHHRPMGINFTKYNGTMPEWDYTRSQYFAIDGAKTTKFEYTTID